MEFYKVINKRRTIRQYPCRIQEPKNPQQIKEFLKVPDGWGLPALVVLGYAVKDPLLPTQVKATVENKVRWNKW